MIEMQVRNADVLITNLRRVDEKTMIVIRVMVQKYGELCKQTAQQLCPVDTGFMRDHIRTDYSPQGLAWSTGWDATDFLEAGLSFYPPYVELGTRRSRAQPSLLPAYNIIAPQFQEELALTLRTALEGP